MFVLFAFAYGIFFVLMNPPYQAPDEVAHFFRAYQISKGILLPEKLSSLSLGGYMPVNFLLLPMQYNRLYGNPKNKTSIKQTLSWFKKLPSSESKELYPADFKGTALHCPVLYIPQIAAIYIGRISNLNPLSVMYLGRLLNLAAWMALIYLSIKMLPFYKWLFLWLALSPMSVYQASSLSADALTNGMVFFFIAFFITKSTEGGKRLNRIELILILVLSLFIALAKVIYLFTIFLYFIIPSKSFGSKRKYLTFTLLLLILCFGGSFIWTKLITKLQVPYSSSVNSEQQLKNVKSDTSILFSVIYNTFKQKTFVHIEQFVGTLGWLDTKLPMSAVYLYMVILFILAFTDVNKGIVFAYANKAIAFSIFVIEFLLLLILAYIYWNKVGNNIIEALQGRYFIPLSPLFFLLFYNNRLGSFSKHVYLLVVIGLAYILSMSCLCLVNRFYLA
ncbi:hypothetical protein MCHI_001048 [Candidatus Magnetoovum chiemensis]|nr:hypothetical protein MCHI_001048 [Candidatus Magnetoovum chiemensis]